MARRNLEQPEASPFEFRPGVQMPRFGGMYRRGDPAQIPPHRFHLAVNVRLVDEMGCRPGLTYVEGQQEEACITGIFEIEDFAVAVYITQLADGGLDSSGNAQTSPFNILGFNEEKSPVTRNYWDEDATFSKKIPSPWRRQTVKDAFNTFQLFNGTLLIANGLDVYEAEFSEDEGAARMDLSHIFSLPSTAAGGVKSTCVRRERVDDAQTGGDFEKDVLYMGGTGGEIWRYDGTTLELVHTLSSGGPMQIINWNGVGLVAAGDNAGGFCYQEQSGFSWQDQAWGRNFHCNGLTVFLGEVVFVGDWDDELSLGKWGAYAMRWAGSGAPTVFASKVPASGNDNDWRFRTPVVAGGALHWLGFYVENDTPPNGSEGWIARWTDFSTGSTQWAGTGQVAQAPEEEPGFFIPYAGGMLLFVRNNAPAAEWPNGDNIVLVFSGTTANFDPVYNWPRDASSNPRLDGNGWEAIAL